MDELENIVLSNIELAKRCLTSDRETIETDIERAEYFLCEINKYLVEKGTKK